MIVNEKHPRYNQLRNIWEANQQPSTFQIGQETWQVVANEDEISFARKTASNAFESYGSEAMRK